MMVLTMSRGELWANGQRRQKCVVRTCNAKEAAAIGAPRPQGVEMIPGSSAVERSTVNRMVACSNQARGAITQPIRI